MLMIKRICSQIAGIIDLQIGIIIILPDHMGCCSGYGYEGILGSREVGGNAKTSPIDTCISGISAIDVGIIIETHIINHTQISARKRMICTVSFTCGIGIIDFWFPSASAIDSASTIHLAIGSAVIIPCRECNCSISADTGCITIRYAVGKFHVIRP